MLVTDQAGKKRLSQTDALGRLVNVWEVTPSDTWTVTVGFNGQNYIAYQTDYLYDALDNLRKVTQGGQERWFGYDSLSRLIRVKNPETANNGSLPSFVDPVTGGGGWSTAYSYDPNGNLLSKTDARNITVNYNYDALNRNTTVNYSDTAVNPDITRVYDNTTAGANGKGRFHYDYAGGNGGSGANVEHRAIDSYDALGRPLTLRQWFKYNNSWSTLFYLSQSYDLAGNVKMVNYPSNRSVTYNYDAAGRLNSFTGNLGGAQQNYATGITYTAAGLLTKEQFGTNTTLYHRRHYNNRQQLFDIRLGTDSNTINDGNNWASWTQASRNRGALYLFYNGSEAFGDGGAYNNGNVYRTDHVVPLDENLSSVMDSICYYGYDELNRLTSVDELPTASWVGNGAVGWLPQSYAQRYKYDRWGNRTINTVATWGININRKAFDANTADNRLNVPAGQAGALAYDPAGNLTNDTYTGAGMRVYDAENRMTSANSTNSYVYDADGRRTRRIISNVETWQIYGIGGELLAEYAANGAAGAPQKEYGYRSGQLLVVAQNSPFELRWQVTDPLGTPRMSVRGTGADGGSLASIARHDYLPFGEELTAGLGVRSTTNGYVGDNVRQKFVGYERDNESGLDFVQARYYSPVQGRFASGQRGRLQSCLAQL